VTQNIEAGGGPLRHCGELVCYGHIKRASSSLLAWDAFTRIVVIMISREAWICSEMIERRIERRIVAVALGGEVERGFLVGEDHFPIFENC